MTKKIQDFRILEKKQLNKEFFVFELSSTNQLPELKPGQFVQVKVEGSPETFLRRPFSIHDVNYDKNTFKLLVKVSGKGTETLSRLNKNDVLNIIFPLGNSFSLPSDFNRILLVGGGCGIAPLLFLGRYLNLNGYKPDFLMGFRNSERIVEYDEYKKLGQVYLITEDGSAGEKGLVINHSILKNRNYERIYCCGPDMMMKAIAEYSHKNNIICEVSLENLMACGIGVCLCCIVDTKKGNVCTCTDGPVFNINDLKW
jgi:dihydroorotate dehydrogenase electron transfer subunit